MDPVSSLAPTEPLLSVQPPPPREEEEPTPPPASPSPNEEGTGEGVDTYA